MAEESLIDGEEENILYDLLVITEWPPETDTQVSGFHFCGGSFTVWLLRWAVTRKKWSTAFSFTGSAAQSHVAQTWDKLQTVVSISKVSLSHEKRMFI